MTVYNLMLSHHKDGKIVNYDSLQKFINKGYNRVAVIEVNDDKIIVKSFISKYELIYDEFKVQWFARLTSDPLLQRWFESRGSYPSFASWLASASSISNVDV